MLVNGGGAVTLQFQRSPFKPLTRTVFVPWNQIVVLPPVVMTLNEEDESPKSNQPPSPAVGKYELFIIIIFFLSFLSFFTFYRVAKSTEIKINNGPICFIFKTLNDNFFVINFSFFLFYFFYLSFNFFFFLFYG